MVGLQYLHLPANITLPLSLERYYYFVSRGKAISGYLPQEVILSPFLTRKKKPKTLILTCLKRTGSAVEILGRVESLTCI